MPAVLVVDAQQNRDRDAVRDDAAAAERQQRQREALGGQHAHVDADVDERLHADPHADALRDERRERTLEPRRLPTDRERARTAIHANSASTTSDAGEAELLGDHREQEVGVRFGQVEELLDAGAQARRRATRRARTRSASARAGSPCRADRTTGRGTPTIRCIRYGAATRISAEARSAAARIRPTNSRQFEPAEEQDRQSRSRRSRRTRRSRARAAAASPIASITANIGRKPRNVCARLVHEERRFAHRVVAAYSTTNSFMSSDGWRLTT